MKATTLSEILWASTMTHHVDSEFDQHGGLMLVAPPGQFKTNMLLSIERQPGVKILSDMTTNDLKSIRDQLASRELNTLVFLDMQKLYERRFDTAKNIMGNIRALMDEGFTGATNDTNQELRAHATVIGALTPSFKRQVWQDWTDNGLSRRLLVSLYSLRNPRQITQAIIEDSKLKVAARVLTAQPLESIPMSVDRSESLELFNMLNDQVGKDTPLIFLKKMFSVLRWKYRATHQKDRAMEVMHDFSKSLGKNGSYLELDL